MRPLYLIFLALLGLGLFIGPGTGYASGADVHFTTVALSGQPAPGLSDGEIFQDLFQGFPPVLNNPGDVLFTAVLSGTTVGFTNDRSIWIGPPGALQMPMRENDSAPGTDTGVVFSDFFSNRPVLTDTGRLMFDATLRGTDVNSGNNQGLWSGTPESFQLVVRTGSPAPDLGGSVMVTSLRMPLGGFHVMNPGGATAFNLLLGGTGVSSANDVGIFAGTAGSLFLRAREGSRAPDTPSGVLFRDLLNSFPVIDASGRIAFQSRLTGSGITTANDFGVWSGPPDVLSLAVREGDAAPGLSGEALVFFNRPVINQGGQLAFSAAVSGVSVGNSNDFSIWVGSPDSLRLAAREGTEAPGAAPAVFGDFFTIDPFLNNRGEVAFNAVLTGEGVNSGNDTGIWAGDPETLRMVAREGDPAPDTPDEVVFDQFRFIEPLLNSAGQVAISGELRGTSINQVNDKGIWLTDGSGSLHLLVREGDVIEVAPGDFRTVREVKGLFGSGDGDGGTTSLNNAGQVAFAAVFSDFTTGIFLTQFQGPAPALLSLSLEPDDMLRLSWEGEGFTLQTAPQVTGPWTDAAIQTNPQLIELLEVELYFRLRRD